MCAYTALAPALQDAWTADFTSWSMSSHSPQSAQIEHNKIE